MAFERSTAVEHPSTLGKTNPDLFDEDERSLRWASDPTMVGSDGDIAF